MAIYKITLEVDEGWLEAINNLTQDIHEGETCTWLEMKEIEGQENNA